MKDLGFLDRVWPDMCAAYRDPALGRACLDMQEEYDADVPLLLVLAIADHAGCGIGSSDVETLVSESEDWRDAVIRPLRRVRKAMKGRFTTAEESGLRDDIKRLELEAERLHVRRIAEVFATFCASGEGASLSYLAMRGTPAAAAREFQRTFNLAFDAQVPPALTTG